MQFVKQLMKVLLPPGAMATNSCDSALCVPATETFCVVINGEAKCLPGPNKVVTKVGLLKSYS